MQLEVLERLSDQVSMLNILSFFLIRDSQNQIVLTWKSFDAQCFELFLNENTGNTLNIIYYCFDAQCFELFLNKLQPKLLLRFSTTGFDAQCFELFLNQRVQEPRFPRIKKVSMLNVLSFFLINNDYKKQLFYFQFVSMLNVLSFFLIILNQLGYPKGSEGFDAQCFELFLNRYSFFL